MITLTHLTTYIHNRYLKAKSFYYLIMDIFTKKNKAELESEVRGRLQFFLHLSGFLKKWRKHVMRHPVFWYIFK